MSNNYYTLDELESYGELYNSLIKQKEEGRQLSIEDLTPEILRQLFGREQVSVDMIAEIFNTTKGKVNYLRKKHNITIRSTLMEMIAEIM